MNNLLEQELDIINVGLPIFNEAVADQGAKSIQVNWHPAAAEDDEIDELLSLLL